MSISPPLISVITATFNCANDLRLLRMDLYAQTDQNFQWVVMDGQSIDETVQIASDFPAHRLRIRSEPDFGVYDALNKAIRLASGEYYVVVGADDRLEPNAIALYTQEICTSGADIVSASVRAGSKMLKPAIGQRWLRGGNALVSSHAVGCAIRKSLHEKVGFYSKHYVNTADLHFIVRAVDLAGAKVSGASFVAGRFGLNGISTVNRICSLSEAYRIQLMAGHNRWIQLAIFIFRLIKEQLRA